MTSKKVLKPMQIRNEGGMLLYTSDRDGQTHTLGYLLVSPQHGVFDAEVGKVEVTEEVAKEHNRVFDAAMIEGLDKNCKVGEGSVFYMGSVTDKDYPEGVTPGGMLGSTAVKTWLGTMISATVIVNGKHIRFLRNGMEFHGRRGGGGDESVFFRRIK